MNRIGPIRYFGMAALMMWAGSMVMAQEPESDETELKQIQEEQMKAMQEQMEQQQQKQEQIMEEQMRARKEMLQQQQEQMRELEEQYAERARVFERQAREAVVTTPVFIGEAPIGTGNGEPFYVSFGSQNNQSQLTLRKTFRGTTSSTSKGEFDVDEDIRQFRCTINGTVRSGEIVIGVSYPDGKTFKELVINSSADVNFSQSVSIKEGEEKKYTGTWKYVIKADEAEGNYMLQIMTN